MSSRFFLLSSARRAGPLRVGAALGLMALAQPAAAQRDPEIDAMRREIRALQQQLNRMQQAVNKASSRPERTAAAAKGGAPAGSTGGGQPVGDLGHLSFPNGRPTFTSGDGKFTLGIYGRVQLDTGAYPKDTGADLNNGWNFRRARLGVVGSIWRDYTYSLIYDFGGTPDGTGSLYEASLGYVGVKPFNFRIGAFKPSFTLEDSISSADLLFLERPSIIEISRSIAAGTARMAAGVSAAEDGWFAATYVTGPTVGTEVDDEQLGVTGRVAFQPLKGKDYLLHVGASGAAVLQPNQNASGTIGLSRQTIRLSDRPELRLDGTRFLDTGLISYRKSQVGGVELAGHYRNLSLQGEYLAINVDQNRAPGLLSPSLFFDGYYVQGSWILTGESRRYSTSNAAYAAPRVERPFYFRDGGGPGAWEVVARYSYVNLDDRNAAGVPIARTGGVRGGQQTTYTAGLNWYPNQNVRFMLDYLYGDIDRLDAAGRAEIGQTFQAVALRSQWSF